MGEWIIGCRANDGLKKFWRERWIPQAPIGLGEIDERDGIMGIKFDGLLKGFDRDGDPAELFLLNDKVVPEGGGIVLCPNIL